MEDGISPQMKLFHIDRLLKGKKIAMILVNHLMNCFKDRKQILNNLLRNYKDIYYTRALKKE